MSSDPVQQTQPSSNLQGFYAWTDTLAGVYYGPGCLETALPKLLHTLGAKRAFVVTGKSLRDKSDVIKRVEAVLSAHGAHAATFADIGQHAPISGIRAGADAFASAGADVFVAVGGGSPIDACKIMAHTLQQRAGGGAGFARIVAVPTTLSAAEYTAGGGYTDEDGHKKTASHPQLAPAGLILDAELTLATPERLWLSTGMRAVDHATENLYRPGVPTPLKFLCHAALAELFRLLPASKAAPQDLAARQALQVAAWMSLWPLKQEKYSALGLSHALGHKLGAKYSIPHGITSCLTLAPTVALMADLASDDDKRWLVGALPHLGKPAPSDLHAGVLELSAAIQKLVDDLGLKSTLSEYNVPRDDVPEIAALALGEHGKDDPRFQRVVQLLNGLY